MLKTPAYADQAEKYPLKITSKPRFLTLCDIGTSDSTFRDATGQDLASPEKRIFLALHIPGVQFQRHFSFMTGGEWGMFESLMGMHRLHECTLMRELDDENIYAIANLNGIDFLFGKLVEDKAYKKVDRIMKKKLPTYRKED